MKPQDAAQRVESLTAELRAVVDETEADASAARTALDSEVKAAVDQRQVLEAANTAATQEWSAWASEIRATTTDQIETQEGKLAKVVEWAEAIKGDIQIAALAAGFREAETEYRRRSVLALKWAGCLAGLTIVVALLFFSPLWDVPDNASSAKIAQHVALRLSAISLPLVVALFAARIYRTNSHLEAVNKERAQAAVAFEGFAARASGDAARDAMLVVLAQLVFAGRDTGHHADEAITLPAGTADVVKGLLSQT
jgi:hypothetical protein